MMSHCLAPSLLLFLLLFAPSLLAGMPAGPLRQMSGSSETQVPDPSAELRAEIESAETIEVSFEKKMEIKDSEKTFLTEGKLYYRREPLFFRAELPSEILQIDSNSRRRLVKKHNEIYVDEWFGDNPFLMYFDIPGGVYESGTSRAAAESVVFRASRGGDEIEAVYDSKEKMLKSVRVENAVMVTFTEIKSWEKNVKLAPGVFDFPRGAKTIDMRR